VGYSQVGNHFQTLTEHWDGSSWRVLSSPNPGGAGQDNVLRAVTATSGSDVWAVGRYNGSLLVPFAMHWNGSSWTVVSLPARESQAIDTDPLSASAAAPGQAWISGASGPDANGRFIPFAVPVPVVPDVSGDTVSAATSALTAAGLTVSSTQNTTTNCSPSISSQIDVVSTDPATGQQASFGQAVTLTVCRVTVINPTVTVPDVTGEDDASARADITSAGLHAGTITLKVNCTIPRGTVLSQTPAGGTTAPFGSSVSLTEATRSGSAVHQITPHFCTQ
jgi:cytochrome c5